MTLAIIAGLSLIGMLGLASAYTIGWLVRDARSLEEIEQKTQRKGAQRHD